MSPPEQIGLFLVTALIGVISALLGLGGGLFLVPLLVLGLDVELSVAAPVSLVCTVATSTSGSVALDKARLANLPLVTYLEMSAALGALLGAKVLSRVLPEGVVLALFAALVAYAAWRMLGKARSMSAEPEPEGVLEYTPTRLPLGMVGTAFAGLASGLLGIGGGPIKVPVQTEVMKVPLKVALANSNLMVGITAAVGAAVYYADGRIHTALLGPCALGIALGAYVGGLIAPRLDQRPLCFAFTGILMFLALQLTWKAWQILAN